MGRVLLQSGSAQGAVVCALTGRFVDVGAWDETPNDVATSVRAGGGRPMFAGDGVVAALVRLPRVTTVERMLNQLARPLIAWLKSMKVPASYFGRDALTSVDNEPVRFSVTGNAEAFLVDIRVALSAGLDVETPRPQKPGDQKPSRPLVELSSKVTTGDAFLMALQEVLGPSLSVDAPAATPVQRHAVKKVATPIGPIGVTTDGMLVGPFHASLGLVERIASLRHLGAEAAVTTALVEPGAFVLGADGGHLVAALEGA